MTRRKYNLNKLGPLANAFVKAYTAVRRDGYKIQEAALFCSTNHDIATVVKILLTYSDTEAVEWAEDNIERRRITCNYQGKVPKWKERRRAKQSEGPIED